MATLGRTDAVSATYAECGDPGDAVVQKITVPAGPDIIATTLNAYARDGYQTTYLKSCIWTMGNSTVANSYSNTVYLPSTSWAWKTITFSTPPVLTAGTSYYIGVISSRSFVPVGASESGGGFGNTFDSSNNYSSPNSLNRVSLSDYNVCIYIEYEEVVSGYGNKVFTSDNIAKVFSVETANIGKVFGS